MRLVTLLCLLSMVLLSRSALAEDRVEALAAASIEARRTTPIDLAEVAGASGYGTANDASPMALGLALEAGLLLPVSLELHATATIAVGGLDLAQVEQRYFGDTEQIGSSVSAAADGSVRFAPLLYPDLRLLVGPAAGWRRLAASSPLGFGRVDLVELGLDAGVLLHLNTISRVVDGYLTVVAFGRRALPLEARVGQSASEVAFSGSGGGPAIYDFGLRVGYVFGFHGRSEAR